MIVVSSTGDMLNSLMEPNSLYRAQQHGSRKGKCRPLRRVLSVRFTSCTGTIDSNEEEIEETGVIYIKVSIDRIEVGSVSLRILRAGRAAQSARGQNYTFDVLLV